MMLHADKDVNVSTQKTITAGITASKPLNDEIF